MSNYPQDTMRKFKLVFLGEQSDSCTIHSTILIKQLLIRLQLWDTAGQERFRSLIPSYIRDSAVAVVVYDISARTSFDQTTKWIDDVRVERGSQVMIFLVGNKTDLEKREVPFAEGELKAKELNVAFIETSAKNGNNVSKLFQTIATNLLRTDPAKNQVEELTEVTLKSDLSTGNSRSCSC